MFYRWGREVAGEEFTNISFMENKYYVCTNFIDSINLLKLKRSIRERREENSLNFWNASNKKIERQGTWIRTHSHSQASPFWSPDGFFRLPLQNEISSSDCLKNMLSFFISVCCHRVLLARYIGSIARSMKKKRRAVVHVWRMNIWKPYRILSFIVSLLTFFIDIHFLGLSRSEMMGRVIIGWLMSLQKSSCRYSSLLFLLCGMIYFL